ncbi:hypothetical protein [Bradyrhizobium sp. BR 1432]
MRSIEPGISRHNLDIPGGPAGGPEFTSPRWGEVIRSKLAELNLIVR